MVAIQIGNAPFIAHGAHFLFEMRSLVDFQIGSEQVGAILMKMAIFIKEHAFCVVLLAHFSFEKRSLIDLQIGNGPYVAHGVRFIFENQILIDFHIVNEQLL